MTKEASDGLILGPAAARAEVKIAARSRVCPKCGIHVYVRTSFGYRGPPREVPVVRELRCVCPRCGRGFTMYGSPGPDWFGGTADQGTGPDGHDPHNTGPRLLQSERASEILDEADLRLEIEGAVRDLGTVDREPERGGEAWASWSSEALPVAAQVLQAVHALRALARDGRATWTEADEAGWSAHVERFLHAGGTLPPGFTRGTAGIGPPGQP
ncbi:MAG: hypothetical protein ABMB14_24100 [Myxococcota bacterium]